MDSKPADYECPAPFPQIRRFTSPSNLCYRESPPTPEADNFKEGSRSSKTTPLLSRSFNSQAMPKEDPSRRSFQRSSGFYNSRSERESRSGRSFDRSSEARNPKNAHRRFDNSEGSRSEGRVNGSSSRSRFDSSFERSDQSSNWKNLRPRFQDSREWWADRSSSNHSFTYSEDRRFPAPNFPRFTTSNAYKRDRPERHAEDTHMRRNERKRSWRSGFEDSSDRSDDARKPKNICRRFEDSDGSREDWSARRSGFNISSGPSFQGSFGRSGEYWKPFPSKSYNSQAMPK